MRRCDVEKELGRLADVGTWTMPRVQGSREPKNVGVSFRVELTAQHSIYTTTAASTNLPI